MNTNMRCDNYRDFFTKDYLMGPNSLRLLDEMLEKYPLKEGSRIMDLGCGMGITSMFLAKEAKVNVFATDLWISATQNAENFKKWNVDDRIIPIHADANDLPYAHEYFDAIVSIDAFHYFAAKKGVILNSYDIDYAMRIGEHIDPAAKTSFQLDIENKKGHIELDALGGVIVKLGHELDVPTPETEKYLKKIVNV